MVRREWLNFANAQLYTKQNYREEKVLHKKRKALDFGCGLERMCPVMKEAVCIVCKDLKPCYPVPDVGWICVPCGWPAPRPELAKTPMPSTVGLEAHAREALRLLAPGLR